MKCKKHQIDLVDLFSNNIFLCEKCFSEYHTKCPCCKKEYDGKTRYCQPCMEIYKDEVNT